MKKLIKSEEASVLIITALFLPVLIGFIGLCLDGGKVLYLEACLMDATDAAGRSTILMSYDREIWTAERRVVIHESDALDNAKSVLEKNFEHGKIVSLEVVEENTIILKTKVDVEFSFLKLFKFEKKELIYTQNYSGG